MMGVGSSAGHLRLQVIHEVLFLARIIGIDWSFGHIVLWGSSIW